MIRNIGWNNIFDNEPWMGQLLKKIFSESKGSFVDVGANIGQTLLKVKSISPGMPYYGFEANPVCLFYLNELIKKNDFESVKIIPVGLSDTSVLASLNFYSKYSDDATASVLEKERPGSKIEKKEFVYLTSLDTIENVIQEPVSVLKIDVEGAELEVLKGAVATINRYHPYIIIEILPAYTSENKWRTERQQELQSLIKSFNYRIFQISKDSYNNFKSVKLIDKIGINSDIRERDYLLIPEGSIAIIKNFDKNQA